MPYELFWSGPLAAFEHYAEKARLEDMKADERAWMQGMYMVEAIAQNFSAKKTSVYPKEPHLVTQAKELKKSAEDKNILLYQNLKNWSAGVKARINKTPSE